MPRHRASGGDAKADGRLRDLLREHAAILELISSTGDLTQSLTRIAEVTERLVTGSHCAIQVASANGHSFNQIVAPSLAEAYASAITSPGLPNTTTPGGLVLATGNSIVADDNPLVVSRPLSGRPPPHTSCAPSGAALCRTRAAMCSAYSSCSSPNQRPPIQAMRSCWSRWSRWRATRSRTDAASPTCIRPTSGSPRWRPAYRASSISVSSRPRARSATPISAKVRRTCSASAPRRFSPIRMRCSTATARSIARPSANACCSRRANSRCGMSRPRSSRESGERKFTHAIARPHRRADGTVVWDGVILDSTRIKEAERQAAATAEQTRQAIVESLSQGFVLLDGSDRLLISNSSYAGLYPEAAPNLTPGLELRRARGRRIHGNRRRRGACAGTAKAARRAPIGQQVDRAPPAIGQVGADQRAPDGKQRNRHSPYRRHGDEGTRSRAGAQQSRAAGFRIRGLPRPAGAAAQDRSLSAISCAASTGRSSTKPGASMSSGWRKRQSACGP